MADAGPRPKPRGLTGLGFARVAAVAPALRVADVAYNRDRTLAALEEAAAAGVHVAVFPELGLTGYTCADLFFQPTLRAAAAEALAEVARATGRLGVAAAVGLPVEVGGRLFNMAAFCAGGRVYGLVPKTYLPTYGEFYEERWFAGARELPVAAVRLGGGGPRVPAGTDLLFEAEGVPGLVVGLEVCEDLWAVEPPGGMLALGGATLLLNLSASPEILGKADYRRDLVRQQSARALAAYAYAGAGPGESTTDLVYSGHVLVAENGRLLAEGERFRLDGTRAVVDVDLAHLGQERLRNTSFTAGAPSGAPAEAKPGRGRAARLRRIAFPLTDRTEAAAGLAGRAVDPRPFVPADEAGRTARCREIFALQATALAARLRHTGSRRVVLGISGGLDSTLALLVVAEAFDRLGLGRAGILAPTLPGYGTTGRTRGNAEELVRAVGAELRVIPIHAAVAQHFADIGHDPAVHDVTYENSQARERTQILMDLANKVGGFVVGTGDLSEAALGWCTFNGDHMSMYHVNIGVPKTLVRHLIGWYADEAEAGRPELARVLRDVLATPITPELLPLDAAGGLQQRTEDTIGPYELHDFFLYHVVRRQDGPARTLWLAGLAFAGAYEAAVIRKWLRVFLRRFFAQQFKRSAMPDGPKVGSVALSPRGDWRMPSDARVDAWLAELDRAEAAGGGATAGPGG